MHPPSIQDPSLQQRLDEILDQSIQPKQSVGAVILVAQEGKLIYDRAVGVLDRVTGLTIHNYR